VRFSGGSSGPAYESVGTRLKRLARHRLGAGIGPNQAAQSSSRPQRRRKISFPIVVVAYEVSATVAMMGDKTNWVRNLRADNHAVLQRGRRENVSA